MTTPDLSEQLDSLTDTELLTALNATLAKRQPQDKRVRVADVVEARRAERARKAADNSVARGREMYRARTGR